MIIDVNREILESLGYKVVAAKSGQEAIEIYRKLRGKIGLVILDMIMPGMDGEATYDSLRKVDDDVRVILSSGYSKNEQAKAILEKGCQAFIQKPFSISDLSMTIRQVLDKNRAAALPGGRPLQRDVRSQDLPSDVDEDAVSVAGAGVSAAVSLFAAVSFGGAWRPP